MDRISKERRSWNMGRIRSQDTRPERVVRTLLHRLGYRFRLHRKDLPGCPDIVLPRLRIVILVHGCFWHRHSRCRRAYTPRSRTHFWLEKFRANRQRDRDSSAALAALGWRVVVVWECETRNVNRLATRLGRCMCDRAPRAMRTKPTAATQCGGKASGRGEGLSLSAKSVELAGK